LISQITNGSEIDISKTGTELKYTPGIVTNNKGMQMTFECPTSRSIVYFLEAILPLALFGKSSLNIKLKGVTNDELDVSVRVVNHQAETVRCVWIPMLKHFGIGDSLDFKIVKRAFAPSGKL
jgi:RNA 3'-terminal phosphate cyclase-like protein